MSGVKYEMEDKPLGEGTFGCVCKAKMPVAIKKIKKGEMDEYSINEIKIMKTLHHENIMKYIDHYEDNQFFYIVMEYSEHGDLSKEIKKGSFTEDKAKSVVRQILSAIKYLHEEKKICHRDLKPQNILWFGNNKIKLSDFGISKTQIKTYLSTKTGTPLYEAPEIFDENTKEYTNKVDIWSIGIITYELLRGSVNFLDISKFLCGDLSVLKKIRSISSDGRDFIEKCLKVNPEERYTATQLFHHSWIKEKGKKDIIYDVKDISRNGTQIFGEEFVKNNKNKCSLIINDKKVDLCSYFQFQDYGPQKVTLIENEPITDFSKTFERCLTVEIESLKDWDVSKGTIFRRMFYLCKNIISLSALKNWDVSSGIDFSEMFEGIPIKNLEGLESWNVSSGKYFNKMFVGCGVLENLNSLEKWDTHNGIDFSYMFDSCGRILSLSGLSKWDVSKGKNFESMFANCVVLGNVDDLKKWNVSSASNLSNFLSNLGMLEEVNGMSEWDVSSCKDFSSMFLGRAEIKSYDFLDKWNFKSGKNFDLMTFGVSEEAKISIPESLLNQKNLF